MLVRCFGVRSNFFVGRFFDENYVQRDRLLALNYRLVCFACYDRSAMNELEFGVAAITLGARRTDGTLVRGVAQLNMLSYTKNSILLVTWADNSI